ncbi:heat shock protein Hsp20 [Solidesulfovibrio fructosivorans JJ]]|uniref:Heat shock protein Hsp20 n=1 Tax=Solidesulfovibrio fructosivorans JJ] TaxID=596151 RepID=E1K271_SOLFR|nr:Hsp20/alpha crystallin family protein [Solidesulfovibrio fructosivorans]EFL49290.1 heat shock protein Hsp20 [Solidesulfovibrio fructosivorans JJ]]
MFKNLLPRLREKSLATKRPMSMADLMEDFWSEPFGALPNLFKDVGYPAVDVSEADGVVTVKAELPGIEPKDVEITIENDTLVLRGEKKFEDEEKKDDYHRIERAYGSFSRCVPLPGKVKEVEAKARFDKGVLTITLPLDAAESAKKITIEG